jgi:orotidine-5'-phosphate decarboxylase
MLLVQQNQNLFLSVRKLVPNSFLLVPGVGAQGGSLSEVAENGMNDQCGLLVNSSRGIIYASKEHDFADQAANQAKKTTSGNGVITKA